MAVNTRQWFAVLAVIAIGFVAKYLPETKGLPLEEVTAVFDRQARGEAAPGDGWPKWGGFGHRRSGQSRRETAPNGKSNRASGPASRVQAAAGAVT